MTLKQLLEQLCVDLSVPCPKFDAEKMAALPINSELTIDLRDLSPGFSLHAKVAPIAIKKREELYIYLMRANFLGQGTGGARIGMDADENFLTLSHGFAYEMDYQTFKESVEDFVNYVLYWREETAKFKET